MMNQIISLKNKKVVVLANGIHYKGILMEVTEDTVTLRTETGWVSVPVEAVRGIDEEGAAAKKAGAKYIDPSFFRFK